MRKLLAVLPMLFAAAAHAADLSLAGPWGVLLDRDNTGEAHGLGSSDHWATKKTLAVQFPGSIQAQDIGDEPSLNSPWTARIGKNLLSNPKYAPYQKPGDFKTPFWLTPKRVYVGAAWFKKEITIPADWADKRITLTLERPHWETTVFLNGAKIGSNNSLAAPHTYDLTAALNGNVGPHSLILRVDNSLKVPVGPDASAVTDQTQSNWNGIVGDLKLSATEKTWIDDLQIYPDFANKRLRVKAAVRTLTGKDGKGSLVLSATGRGPQSREEGAPDLSTPITWTADGTSIEVDYPIPSAKPWDEFSPFVYDLKATLKPDNAPVDARSAPFGFRDLAHKDTQITLNNRPIYLRGTLECAIFPLTGYPPAGKEGEAYWRKIYTTLQAHGLNHLRFHSWCPPEIAFTVADEMGIYLQIEAGVWAAFGSSGRAPSEPEAPDAGGRGGNALDTWIVTETDAMLRAFGNHPSFLLMAAANEPGSRTNQPNANFLNALIPQWKAKDSRHLYTAGSNWPNVANADFQVMSRPRLNSAGVLTKPPQTMHDYAGIVSQWKVPVISHESGQWCVYPNFDEIPKYTGALKPGNLEIFKDFLTKAGMGDQAREFLMASGKFQALLYKEEIEALLRTPHLGGFQLLDLHDFPGQGTAPIGVVDAFWDSKPYITPAEFKQFCNATVPLARLPKRIFTTADTLTADIDIAHYGPADLPAAGRFATRTTWRLLDSAGKAIQQGTLSAPDIAAGKLTRAGQLSLPLQNLPAPAKLTLEVSVATTAAIGSTLQGDAPRRTPMGDTFTNTWDVWLYPPPAEFTPPANVKIARALDADTLAYLENGGILLLSPPPDRIAGNARSSFFPIFWNRITFPNPTKEHTLSILCDPKHPAFALFPTDAHTNWQWSPLLQPANAKPMILDGLPRELRPLVQFIDDWDTARRLALVVEARVGKGKLLLSSIDLHASMTPSESSPPQSALLRSVVNYISGENFRPQVALTPAQIAALLMKAE